MVCYLPSRLELLIYKWLCTAKKNIFLAAKILIVYLLSKRDFYIPLHLNFKTYATVRFKISHLSDS